MKKNISINLQGIIFHIEEDGYEQLSRYLTSIRMYFSNYEGHEEIVADIESRIAEIFSGRLNPGKQVISLEDVEYLITRMGDVTDFEVMDPIDEEIPSSGPQANSSYTSEGPKKLYRDINHKVLGGVCAGVANYLNFDPLWVRIFFVLLVLLGIVSAGVSAATGIIIYVLLWIAMPQSEHLPETTVKKLFRDPEDKKLAGVASGIAKYFGVDVAAIRILFLILFFAGGFGVLAYIVLWIAMPEAVTLTEKMQMQGDPVTLAGIEQSLKSNLNMRDSNGEENTFAKIILLPIRLISQIFNWLGSALGPILAVLLTIVRIGAGIILLIVSVSLTIGLCTAFLVSTGLIEESQYLVIGDFPASVFLGGFPRLGLVAGFVVGLIPLLLLSILAISLLIQRTFLRPIIGWSMFGVWLVGLFTLIATIIMFSTNFRRSGEVITTKSFAVANSKTLVLDAYDNNLDYDHIYIDVQATKGDQVEVTQRAEAKGRTEEEAKQNANMIAYRVLQKDSVIRFDNSYEFKKGAIFRDQELSIVLKLPENKPLRLTRQFTYMLPSGTFAREYSHDKIVRNTWQVKGNQLECLTCASDTLDTEEIYLDDAEGFNAAYDSEEGSLNIRGSFLLNENEYGNNVGSFGFTNFDKLDITGPFHVQIRQGKNYNVKIRRSNKAKGRIDIDKDGEKLIVKTEKRFLDTFKDNDPVLIQITAPNFTDIDLSGAVKADIGKIETDRLNLNFSGAIKSTANLNVRNLRIDITGASISKFTGQAENLEMDVTGASGINAQGLKAKSVNVDATGASVVEVYATSSLRADASGASRITYKGNPGKTVIDSSGPSSIKRL